MRIVILTSEHPPSANAAVQTLVRSRALARAGVTIVGIVAAETVTRDERGVGKLWKLWQRLGSAFFFRFVGMVVIQLAMLRFGRWFAGKRRYHDLDELAREAGATYHETTDINTPRTIAYLRSLKPDLVISCLLLQKVGTTVLAIPPHGAINFHPALFSEHRGTFASFWTLFRGARSSGATVHRMTPRFDDGEVLVSRKFLVYPSDSMHCLNLRAAKLGGALLAKAIVRIARGEHMTTRFTRKLGQFVSLPTADETHAFLARGGALIRWRNLFDY